VATHVLDGLKLTVDRGPNWLFVKLRSQRRFPAEIPQIADQLWSIAARHFIYRLVLELEELNAMPADMIEQFVLLQERLGQCGGALRICGLSAECAEVLRDCQLDAALPNYATRQAAVLGSDAAALREKLKEVMASSADDESDADDAHLERRQPCLQ
jgi:anti-anti-sigma regulatory factor